jgi:ribosomal protein L34
MLFRWFGFEASKTNLSGPSHAHSICVYIQHDTLARITFACFFLLLHCAVGRPLNRSRAQYAKTDRHTQHCAHSRVQHILTLMPLPTHLAHHFLFPSVPFSLHFKLQPSTRKRRRKHGFLQRLREAPHVIVNRLRKVLLPFV